MEQSSSFSERDTRDGVSQVLAVADRHDRVQAELDALSARARVAVVAEQAKQQEEAAKAAEEAAAKAAEEAATKAAQEAAAEQGEPCTPPNFVCCIHLFCGQCMYRFVCWL